VRQSVNTFQPISSIKKSFLCNYCIWQLPCGFGVGVEVISGVDDVTSGGVEDISGVVEVILVVVEVNSVVVDTK
jgi:hypothetical protein